MSQLDIEGPHCDVSFTPLMEYVTWPALSVNLAFSLKLFLRASGNALLSDTPDMFSASPVAFQTL